MSQSATDEGAETTTTDTAFEGVVFRIAGEPYAIDVRDAASIVAMKELTEVPRSTDSVDGVVDLRGEITVVIDPRELLELDTTETPRHKQRIIILDPYVDSQRVGLRVDSVDGVKTFDEGQYDEDGSRSGLNTPGLDSGLLEAIIHPDEGESDIIGVLDADTVIEESKVDVEQ